MLALFLENISVPYISATNIGIAKVKAKRSLISLNKNKSNFLIFLIYKNFKIQ